VETPLQKLPSSQFVLLATGGCVTAPLVVLHRSVVQTLPSSTGFGVPGTHVPAPLHASPSVQALPSVHGVAFALKA
jgi:hypothetical protein